MPFNWFDIALLLLILLSGLAGLKTGFVKMIAGLVTTIAALVFAFWSYHMVAAKIAGYISTPVTADLLGFLIVFLGIMILGALVGMVLARLFSAAGLSWVDSILGGCLGVLRGILIIAGFAAIALPFAPTPVPDYLASSRVLPYTTQLAAAFAEAAPREVKDAFFAQWNRLKQLWAENQGKRSTA